MVFLDGDNAPLTDQYIADLVGMIYYVFALFKGEKWRVSSGEAMAVAKPARRMIHRYSRRIPIIEKTIRIAAEPSIFVGALVGIAQARSDGAHAMGAPAAAPVYPQAPAPVHTNGRASAPPTDPDKKVEMRLLTRRTLGDVE